MNPTLQHLIDKYGITLTKEQTAKEIGVCPVTVMSMLRRGDIKAKRAGARWIIPTQSVSDFLTNDPEPVAKFKYDKRQKLIV